MRKLWFDTEFNEYDVTLNDGRVFPFADPISIGVVDDQGRSFMAVFKEFSRAAAQGNEWIMDNVVSKLPPEDTWKSRAQIRAELLDFIGEDEPTEFRYWFAPQDALILQNVLTPRFLDMPPNIAGYPFNIAQKFNDMGAPRCIIPPKRDEHEVLADAEWTRDFDFAMDKFILENDL